MKTYLFGLLAALAALLWIISMADRSSDPRPVHIPSDQVQPTLNWSGDSSVYQLQVEAWSNIGRQTGEAAYQLSVSGTLHVKGFTVADGYRVAMQMAPVKVLANGIEQPALATALTKIFYVQMGTDGRMGRFEFSPIIDDDTADFISGLLYTLDVIFPVNDRKVYTASHQDGLGDYLASYSQQGEQVRRRKLRYLRPEPGQKIEILASETDFRVDTAGNWLQELNGREQLRVSLGDDLFQTDTVTTVSLVKMDTPQTSLLDDLTDVRMLEDLSTKPAPVHSKPKLQTEAEPPVDLGQLLGSYTELSHEQSLLLRQTLRNNPELMLQLPQLLSAAELSDKMAAELIKILGIVGLPQAQESLVEIASSPSFDAQDQFRAVISLSGLTQPLTPETENFLLGSFDALATQDELPDALESSLLVAGAIAGNLRTSYPQQADQLNADLLDLVTQATTPRQQRKLLIALGNSRAEENIPVLGRFLDDVDPQIKEAAATALGKYDSPEASEILTASLQHEQDVPVTKAILRGLQRKKPDFETLETVGKLLLNSNDTGVRRLAVQVLDGQTGNRSQVRKLLRQALETETSRQNMKLIIEAYDR
ncbi:hypothetical protein C2E25_04515 [Geothermobacter hydrogeniphilus]|uniref:HEAT repeat domain-containing protein n=1 Tax=Geothermobacter hydrogeniphilus TaxID=1969733 RepID=A0A2K2HCN9_9BACT|nr:HEAT repeat domain-containing protein [Geothermobacter hydrogeniphilus]PNU21068.1 hypothetical protein C2E25_04515 [Geothermobacter hydrogeniphilus]